MAIFKGYGVTTMRYDYIDMLMKSSCNALGIGYYRKTTL
jgi:hypothetical protein